MLLAGQAVVPEGKAARSKNSNKKDWVASQAYGRFLEVYKRFLQEEVLPKLGAAAGVGGNLEPACQAAPVLRVVMPSEHFATKPHRDAEYGHVPEELNFWVPLTPVGGSNSLFA